MSTINEASSLDETAQEVFKSLDEPNIPFGVVRSLVKIFNSRLSPGLNYLTRYDYELYVETCFKYNYDAQVSLRKLFNKQMNLVDFVKAHSDACALNSCWLISFLNP